MTSSVEVGTQAEWLAYQREVAASQGDPRRPQPRLSVEEGARIFAADPEWVAEHVYGAATSRPGACGGRP